MLCGTASVKQVRETGGVRGRMPGEDQALPDFAFILSIEQVLSARPLGHHELQGRLACGSREAAQELQEGFQLSVHQMSEHHDQRLGGDKDTCFREGDSEAWEARGAGDGHQEQENTGLCLSTFLGPRERNFT